METTARSQIILFLLIALASLPLFLGRFYATGDMRDVTIPIESFFHTEELQARIPSWNPNAAYGFPLIAAAQIGFFYPPLLVLRLLPLPLYLPLILFMHLFALGWGMFVLLRTFGRSEEAALFGALSFTLSAFVWQHTTHLNIVLAVAWLPWQFLWVKAMAEKEYWRVRDMVIMALLIGIPFLIGQFQIQTFSVLVFLLYMLSVNGWAGFKKRISWLCLGFLLVVGITAVQILPTYELSRVSSRGENGSFNITTANQHSFPLYQLPTFLFPRFFGHDDTYFGKRLEIEYGVFIGTLPLLLALLVMLKKRVWQEPGARFFLYLLMGSFLLALGNLSPLRLIGLEPSLWIFSAPARWLLFTVFSLSFFAAYGFDYALPLLTKKWWQRTIFSIFTLIVCWNIALMAISYVPDFSSYVSPQASFAEAKTINTKIYSLLRSAGKFSMSFSSPWTYLPFLVLGGGLLSYNKRYYKTVLLYATAVELILVASTTLPTLPWRDILSLPATAAHLPTQVQAGQSRIYSVREGGDTGAYFTNPASRANTKTRLLQRNLLLPLMSSQFNLAGVEWPASLDIETVTKTLSRLRGDEGYNIQDPSLVADLNIGAVLVPANLPTQVPGELTRNVGGVDIYAITAKPRAEFISSHTQASLPLDYIIREPAAGEVKLTTADAGTLIIRDLWYPGWQAQIDGQATTITRYPPFFRAISIPAGSTVVTLQYKPTLLYIGLGISIMTILLSYAMLKTSNKLVSNKYKV